MLGGETFVQIIAESHPIPASPVVYAGDERKLRRPYIRRLLRAAAVDWIYNYPG